MFAGRHRTRNAGHNVHKRDGMSRHARLEESWTRKIAHRLLHKRRVEQLGEIEDA